MTPEIELLLLVWHVGALIFLTWQFHRIGRQNTKLRLENQTLTVANDMLVESNQKLWCAVDARRGKRGSA